MQVIAGWLVVLVAFAAFTGGASAAAEMASKVGSITGMTVGAIVSATDDMVSGFNDAKKESDQPARKHKANSPRLDG
jgi:Ca2+/Na+ antiporter